MYEKYLIDSGLSPEQAKIYEVLLKSGSVQAGRLALIVGIKRPLVYKILEQLMALGLVEKVENKKIARFLPTHPSKVKELLEKKGQEVESAKGALDSIIGNMYSDFNLISGKPSVQFFEGVKGVWKVLDDTLSLDESDTTYQFVDLESVSMYGAKIDEEYSKKTNKKGIKRCIIVPDKPANRELLEYVWEKGVEYKLMPCTQNKFFETVVYIYKNRLAYVSFRKDEFISILISSAPMYEAHELIFKQLWDSLPVYQPKLG